MSDLQYGFNISRAMRYNGRVSYVFSDELMERWVFLSEGICSKEFAEGVYEMQVSLGFDEGECDGMLGKNTYEAMMIELGVVCGEYIVVGDERVRMPIRAEYKLVTFDEAGGLDLHRYSNYSRRRDGITSVCMHWGGLDARHCFRVFSTRVRKVSSHFLIGLEDGECVVYQVLDLRHKAWHAGKYNECSIGVDICQQPGSKYESYYQERGYEVELSSNKSTRGPSECLTLDPRIADGVRVFVRDLCDAMNLGFEIPEDASKFYGIRARGYSVYCHSMVSKKKWDIAPWFSELFID